MYEGDNVIQEGQNFTVEQLQTVWNGLCLKITYGFFTFDRPHFMLTFNESLDPNVERCFGPNIFKLGWDLVL